MNKRILSIANFIDINDKLIDVGCDHGYLGIYLIQNNLVSDILLTDISQSALNVAINNINKSHLNIKTLVTDGLNNIDLNKYNTISISGMGTTSIIKILNKLKNNNTINKLVIQSNNDLKLLREEIIKLGYYLDDEITLKENDIFYVICKFIKGNKKLSNDEIKFGLLKKDKIPYYNYLISQNNKILSLLPKDNIKDKQKLESEIIILNKLLEESR